MRGGYILPDGRTGDYVEHLEARLAHEGQRAERAESQLEEMGGEGVAWAVARDAFPRWSTFNSQGRRRRVRRVQRSLQKIVAGLSSEKTAVDEVLEPNADPRRLSHLRRSDEAFERAYDPEPISDLPEGGAG